MEQDTEAQAPSNGSKAKAPAQPRSDKALPTDRLKFDQQINALKAIAVASGNGERAVGADDIAPRLGIASTTAGLNNQFFMESGLITREAKGRYKPTKDVITFARKHTFDASGSGRELAKTLSQTWYFRAVQQQLGMGATNPKTMVRVLADAAGAFQAHEAKLTLLLAWLEFAGLIDTTGGTIKMTKAAPEPTPQGPEKTEDPADPKGTGTTTQDDDKERPTPAKSDAVLTFNFDFALTAEDLKALSPEQIQQVFKAVGEVMAIKVTAKT